MADGTVRLPSAPARARTFAGLRTLKSPQGWLPALAVAIGVVLIASPFLATVVRSLLVGEDGSLAAGLGNFIGMFGNKRFWEALGMTAIMGTGATLLACLFGLGLAWIVARTDLPGRNWFDTLNLIPFFLSPFVGAVSWTYLAAPNVGLLNQLLAALGLPADMLNIYSVGGVIWVLALFYTPYVYLFIISPMRRMDPALEDAARAHGAGFWLTLRHVTAPLMMPALLSGALVVFVTSAGLFDVPLALASPHGIRTIPTTVFQLVQYPSDYGLASAIGVMVMAVTVLITLMQRNYLSRRSFATVTGKGYRPRTVQLGRWKMAALALELVYIGGGVVAPMAALVMVALSPLWTGKPEPASFTLANFEFVLFNHDMARRAMMNSLIVATLGATVGVLVGTLQSYYLQRGRSRLRTIMDAFLSLPIGIPGIILGLGFLILALRTPLYSTLWIILIAYIARFLPFATRGISAMLVSLSTDLEESARAGGATWLQTMRMIVLPLIWPAILAAWLMLFVIFIRELGATILLYAQGTETISVAMVIMGEMNFGYVAALAVIQALLLFVAFVLFRLTRSSLLEN
ncbi:MAG: ABC transporter permease subunit [Betaproteobacteria bacterium]|nr:ABC transporter permease subunit [Betaproteobacteria bacterium]